MRQERHSFSNEELRELGTEKMELRELLAKHFDKQKKKFIKYSLDDLAKETGVSKTTLSGFLNRQRIPSQINLLKIATTITTKKSIIEKYSLDKESKIKYEKHRKKIVSPALYKKISDWEYFAIIGLCRIKNNSSSPKWIAEKLNIEKSRAKKCLELLIKEKLVLESNGKLYKVYNHIMTKSGVPNKDIKKSHSQAINIAEEAMYTIDIKYRQYLTTNLTIKDDHLDEAKEELAKFMVKFLKKYSTQKDADSLFKLNFQFFPLTKMD